MSPITDDEQVDELKQRRTARGSRSARKPPAPRVSSADPARDLLDGLITNGAPEVEPAVVDSPADAAPAPPARAHQTARKPDPPAGPEVTQADTGGEKIDELIRRVKEGTPAADETATQRRRPKGTADLPPGVVPQRSRRRTRARPSKSHKTRLIGSVATAAVVGISLLVVSLAGTSGRPHTAGSVATSTSKTQSSAAFGSGLTRAIAALGPELGLLARRAATATNAARAHHKAARRRPARSHTKTRRRTRRLPRRSAHTAPASSTQTATTVQSPTYTTTSPTPVTPSPSPVTATHPTTSTSRSSGPTGSNPLGGIGSCVQGC